jgi:hypothetical protein
MCPNHPCGSSQAFRTTSRKYYNFTNDAHRKGCTIKPFSDRQSWKLLMKLLGPEWVEQDKEGLIKGTEERAAVELLRYLGGVSPL